MELTCPSCSSKHKTEDYPGAFEIQCSCGYSILVPDEIALNQANDEVIGPPPSFDDAPMAMDEMVDSKFALANDASQEDNSAAAQQNVEAFSSLNLTDPQNLPNDMPYDPFELQNQWPQTDASEPLSPPASGVTLTQGLPSKTKAPVLKEPTQVEAATPVVASRTPKTEGQDIVNRIQMASIGYLQGPMFDLEIKDLSSERSRDLADHTQKFLSTRTYLREGLTKEFEDLTSIFTKSHIQAVPEILAVEIYLYCAKHQITCHFSAHKEA